MLLTEEDFKRYIPTTMVDTNCLEKHEQRAIHKHLNKYLGQALCQRIEATPKNPAIVKLLEYLKGAIANLAYLEATPFLDLVSTKTGFGVVSNQNIAPASQQRVDSFKKACLNAAHDYIDQSLQFLELVHEDYPEWNKSSLLQNSLIPSIQQWSPLIDISLSRVQFIALIPYILRTEVGWLSTHLGHSFVKELAQKNNDQLILQDLRHAIAFKAYFFSSKSELTIYNEQAESYLRRVIETLKMNLEDYPTYKKYGYAPDFQNDLNKFGFFVTP